ncbi:unnamed protein product, partial [Prunus brigantina]
MQQLQKLIVWRAEPEAEKAMKKGTKCRNFVEATGWGEGEWVGSGVEKTRGRGRWVSMGKWGSIEEIGEGVRNQWGRGGPVGFWVLPKESGLPREGEMGFWVLHREGVG